jgi:hypothetical protein
VPDPETGRRTTRAGNQSPAERHVVGRTGHPDEPLALSGAEREALAAEILDVIETRGLPPGAWLVDIARVRDALQSADALLRRMEEAIIRAARESPRAER